MKTIESLLANLYTKDEIIFLLDGIKNLWEKYKILFSKPIANLSEKDIVLITYGNQVYTKGIANLKTLNNFLDNYLKEQISIVHILPFYPYSSDDGFSILDYYQVDPSLGGWNEIEQIASSYRLLFDAVINHNSSKSDWFKKYLEEESPYNEYYINVPSEQPFSEVVRPRTTPLTHTFNSNDKIFNVWTTFSEDQVDLNYKSPQLLLHVLDVLLFYVSKGASVIRLDAVGFLWKQKHTSCIHLPQTHDIIKLIKLVIAHLNKSVMLLTETNVPHKDNISYFGPSNEDEADMVYNFTLPPLLAFSLLNETTEKLQTWLSSLEVPKPNVCYFNFLASHDGIGVMPVQNILDSQELNMLINSASANGGRVSYKSVGNGKKVPYEINCNYLNLLFGEERNESLGIKRSLLAHAILLTIPGLPAIYFHSMVGSLNDIEGMQKSGQNRRINRQKFEYNELAALLNVTGGRQHNVLSELKRLIDVRKKEETFSPYGSFKVLDTPNGVIGIARYSDKKVNTILGYFNLKQNVSNLYLPKGSYYNILDGNIFEEQLELLPLNYVWLKRQK